MRWRSTVHWPPRIRPGTARLPAGHGAEDDERLLAGDDGRRQRRVGRLVGEVLLAGVETHERASLPGVPVPDRAGQHWEPGFERIEHDALGNRRGLLDR